MAVPWWWFEMRAALDAAGSSTLMPQSFVEILRRGRGWNEAWIRE